MSSLLSKEKNIETTPGEKLSENKKHYPQKTRRVQHQDFFKTTIPHSGHLDRETVWATWMGSIPVLGGNGRDRAAKEKLPLGNWNWMCGGRAGHCMWGRTGDREQKHIPAQIAQSVDSHEDKTPSTAHRTNLLPIWKFTGCPLETLDSSAARQSRFAAFETSRSTCIARCRWGLFSKSLCVTMSSFHDLHNSDRFFDDFQWCFKNDKQIDSLSIWKILNLGRVAIRA